MISEPVIYQRIGLNWIEQCFTSPTAQYRLYGRRFLEVKRPNQKYQSTEGTNSTQRNISERARREVDIDRASCAVAWQSHDTRYFGMASSFIKINTLLRLYRPIASMFIIPPVGKKSGVSLSTGVKISVFLLICWSSLQQCCVACDKVNSRWLYSQLMVGCDLLSWLVQPVETVGIRNCGLLKVTTRTTWSFREL